MSGLLPEQAKAEGGPAAEGPVGLYVHVPFCASTCDFCAFYQEAPTAGDVRRYFDGLEREAELVAWPARVETVFWGGGTPGLLAARDLKRLGELVRGWCGGGMPREWTIELAPGSVSEARLEALREVGVTRVSLGVQSFRPEALEGLGRRHTREQAVRAYERVRAAGFASVNLDLMFALPGQGEEERAADAREAIAMQPDHLSTYCLTFEEDTKLWIKLSQGRVRLDPEHEARMYEATWGQLEAAGFAQYEVSNFARPGHACLHNLNTWRMHEWIGLGPSAASQQAGWRGANVADLTRWLEALRLGRRAEEDRACLTPTSLAEDALIFGLRMNAGVDLAGWRRRAPEAPWRSVDELLGRLADEGLLVQEGGGVRLTQRVRLMADAVGAAVMEAFEAEVTA